ncbi:hypothetical protein EBR57_05670 [bacterium]|nr:hypothetical protein [bacterium]
MCAGKVSFANLYVVQNSNSGFSYKTLKKEFPDTGPLFQSNPTTSPIATAVGIHTAAKTTK